MSDDPKPEIQITCPKCKATVLLVVRRNKNWTLAGGNVPDQCVVLLDHLIRLGNPGNVRCGILENEKAKITGGFRKSRGKWG